MKRSDLYIFQEGLEMAQMTGAKFTYAVKKNKDRLVSEIRAMEKAKEPAEDFKVYQKELDELYKEHAEKDALGNPKTEAFMLTITKKGRKYILPGKDDSESDYTKALIKLQKKHKEAIETQEKREEEYQEFLKEETEWEPFMIDLETVPEDIHQSIMDRIIFMIKDKTKL